MKTYFGFFLIFFNVYLILLLMGTQKNSIKIKRFVLFLNKNSQIFTQTQFERCKNDENKCVCNKNTTFLIS